MKYLLPALTILLFITGMVLILIVGVAILVTNT
jgi:hypothetical protein